MTCLITKSTETRENKNFKKYSTAYVYAENVKNVKNKIPSKENATPQPS